MKLILFFIAIESLLIFNSSAQDLKPENNDSMWELYNTAKSQFSDFEKTHGKFIQTENVNMHYLEWGNKSDPSLIWVHGSMNNGYELLHIADSLVKAGFHVIAIDYYGHGATAIPNHEVSLYHVADDIKFLMDKLSIEKAFVGGFSRGGYIATAFYDSYPESILGLILEDGGSVSSNTYYHKLASAELNARAKNFDTKNKQPWDTIYDSRFEAYKSLYDKNEKGSQFPVLALIKKNRSEKWSIIYSEMMVLFHLGNSQQFLDLTLRPTKTPLFASSIMMIEPKIIFRNLNVPILIFDPVGQNDPMPFEKENQALKNQHPDLIEHITYKDTEHNIHYEHPKRFTFDVITFLKKAMR